YGQAYAYVFTDMLHQARRYSAEGYHLASVRHTTVSMSNPTDRVEIITSVQRRRGWTASEKVRIVDETFEPGMTVSLVARRHGVAPNQLFTWRRLVVEGGADGRRQRRTGGAGVGLSGFAEPGARAATAARQEDAGSRDPQ